MIESRNMVYAKILSTLIRAETISANGEKDLAKFEKFHKLLQVTFPNLFSTAVVENFDGSLLLRWQGKDSGKQPLLLMSHHDVVEASGIWNHPPFEGVISKGKLWGRGTLDTKGSLWAMLQAAEEMIEEGFIPDRDIYFESACNEETSGAGSDAISAELEKRGIRFFMTLDEGGMMLYDPIGGADGTFAMVGVGEKGCADLRFTARSKGGHAATPGKNTPLVRLGKFMAAAEKKKLFEIQLSPVVQEMFERTAPYTKGVLRLLFSHVSMFRPVLCKVLPRISATAGAMLKTTLAFTMCQGSDGRNVLPQEAWVIGNMRYSHHQGRESSISAIKKLAAKYDILTEVLDPGFESSITDYQGEPFKLVERAVSEIFPGVVPLPYIMTGASDSRFFGRVSEHCIRFAPFLIDDKQLNSIHGIDENVDIDTLASAVDFYKYIIREV